jgi:hypothetical protein
MDTEGASEPPVSSDGARLAPPPDVDEPGFEVAAGVLHAASAPPIDAARASVSRMRLIMDGVPPFAGRRIAVASCGLGV